MQIKQINVAFPDLTKPKAPAVCKDNTAEHLTMFGWFKYDISLFSFRHSYLRLAGLRAKHRELLHATMLEF